MEILKAYVIPTKIVDSISLLYQDTEAHVMTPDEDTDSFKILAGVLQGDTSTILVYYRPGLHSVKPLGNNRLGSH